MNREEGNCFESYEEEVGFAIRPGDFQKLCLGYVTQETMREALKKVNIEITSLVMPQNLSRSLEGMRIMSPNEIEEVVNHIRHQIKKD